MGEEIMEDDREAAATYSYRLEDDQCLILDLDDFYNNTSALAVKYVAGELWHIDSDTLMWVKTAGGKPAGTVTTLKRV